MFFGPLRVLSIGHKLIQVLLIRSGPIRFDPDFVNAPPRTGDKLITSWVLAINWGPEEQLRMAKELESNIK